MMDQFTPTHFLISIAMGIVWGFACMVLAKEKGRNPRGWFILGLLFSFFALLTLVLIPSQKAMQLAAEAKATEEKERLKKEEELKEALKPVKNTLETRQWWYLDENHNQVGPIDLEALKKEKSEGNIHTKTYLWSEGMLDWMILNDLSYLKTELE